MELGNHRAACETFLLAFVLGEGGLLQTHFCEFVCAHRCMCACVQACVAGMCVHTGVRVYR